jgi:hypothetical protein
LQQGNIASQEGGGRIEVYATKGTTIEPLYDLPIQGIPMFLAIGP